jgi:hypothetical protein
VLAAIYALLSLIYLAWLMWTVMLPEHRRQEMTMRLLKSCVRVTNRLGPRAAVPSLAREMATGSEQYAVPWAIARTGLWLDDRYQQARKGITS